MIKVLYLGNSEFELESLADIWAVEYTHEMSVISSQIAKQFPEEDLAPSTYLILLQSKTIPTINFIWQFLG